MRVGLRAWSETRCFGTYRSRGAKGQRLARNEESPAPRPGFPRLPSSSLVVLQVPPNRCDHLWGHKEAARGPSVVLQILTESVAEKSRSWPCYSCALLICNINARARCYSRPRDGFFPPHTVPKGTRRSPAPPVVGRLFLEGWLCRLWLEPNH